MNKDRKILGFLMILVVIFIVINLSSLAQQKTVELKIGTSQPPGHPQVVACEMAADTIFEKTNGRIKVSVFPSSQLGGSKDMVQSTMMGTQEMIIESAGLFAAAFPRISVFDAPYIVRDLKHGLNMFKSPIGQEILKEFSDKLGVRILSAFYYGTRHITSNRPIYSLSDMKGFKLRVPEQKISVDWVKAIGGTPTPMAFAEVYLALKTGVIDGQENPLVTIDTQKFYEVQDYLNMTSHQVALLLCCINENIYQSLSPEDKEIVASAFEEAANYNNALMVELEDSMLKKLEDAGMEVIRPDLEPFIKASQTIYTEFEDTWGKGTWEALWDVD